MPGPGHPEDEDDPVLDLQEDAAHDLAHHAVADLDQGLHIVGDDPVASPALLSTVAERVPDLRQWGVLEILS